MNLLKKVLKFISVVLIVFIVGSVIYIYTAAPSLPKETDNIIESAIKSPLPEIVKGKTGFAKSQGLAIWYESIEPQTPPKGTILLIMGITVDALGWTPKFVQSFVDSGYQVIRFDNRGTGLSDWLKNWDRKKPYLLADMAEDGIAILDTLGIAKAHLVGVSMGMIAQDFAINHPNRVASMTSIMSSGYIEDPSVPPVSTTLALDLISSALRYGGLGDEKNMIKQHFASRLVLRGKASYDLNIKEISENTLYNIRKRKGYNPIVSLQHYAAIKESGSRLEKLKTLNLPVLIIHGKSDPFIPIEHGKKCAAIIPNADSLWLDNMAHDIPDILIDTISKRIMHGFNENNDE